MELEILATQRLPSNPSPNPG